MRIPIGWLREFVPTDLPADELTERMTHRGIKVEGLLSPWSGLEGVIVAKVVDVRDHPDSDKLCVATIHDGSAPVELVVGVRNMAPGDLVPWAPPGARVPVLPEPLSTRRIRGVISNGMLCSLRELGISGDHGGIALLGELGLDPGADLKRALGLDEPVIDIEVEPNRPDFLSIFGVAREVAALVGVPLVPPSRAMVELDEPADEVASISIEAPDACPRYIGRVIRGVRRAVSPLAAQVRLTACGMRPVDAVVDATNYAMLELGQPLHAFDLATLEGPGIVVRHAHAGEHLRTLDDVDRTLEPEDLLICDLGDPIALAGIMGGQRTEVTEATTHVLLESATFTRGGVLRTARRLDLRSEASHRFERGVDPEGLEAGAARGAELIAAWTGALVMSGAAEAGAAYERRWVSMRPARATAVLGYEVSPADATEVFDTLSLTHRAAGDQIEVEVPGYRSDILAEVDLIEEVVRVQGYDRVGSSLPRSSHAGGVPAGYALVRSARAALVRAGLREIRPAPFASQHDLDMFGDTDAVPIANPLRTEEGFLRTRLTPGLLRTVARNRALGAGPVGLFEVGTTFRLADPFVEHRKAGFVLAGSAAEGWDSPDRPFDVLDAKGVLMSFLDSLGVQDVALGEPLGPPFHPGRSASVSIGGRHAGVLGEIHPRVAAELDIEGRVAVGVVGLSAIEAATVPFEFREMPRFPPLRRDLAFIVDEGVPAGAVNDAIATGGGPLLEEVTLFDVYRGPAIPEGTKSLAFTATFRAPDHTLSDVDAEPLVAAVVAAVGDATGGTLRTA